MNQCDDDYKNKDKDSEARKTHNTLSANLGNSRNEGQSGQALGQAKKNSRPNCKSQ